MLKDADCRTDHFAVHLHEADDTIATAKAGLPHAPSEVQPRIRGAGMMLRRLMTTS